MGYWWLLVDIGDRSKIQQGSLGGVLQWCSLKPATCHMSAIYICTLRFGWQASICNGGLAGSIYDGREGVPSVVWWVAWQGIFWFNCWIGTVDWDMWFWMFLVQGCNQIPGHCKMGRWAPNASSLWRQLGWNRNFGAIVLLLFVLTTLSLLVSLITICCFFRKFDHPPCLFSSSEHLMSLTPQILITLWRPAHVFKFVIVCTEFITEPLVSPACETETVLSEHETGCKCMW